jgi:hypothetical protein
MYHLKPTCVGSTIGLELEYGTTTADSIKTASLTFVSVVRITLPAKMVEEDVAVTVGSERGTPGELLTCVTARR